MYENLGLFICKVLHTEKIVLPSYILWWVLRRPLPLRNEALESQHRDTCYALRSAKVKKKKSKQEGSCVRPVKFFALGHFGWQNLFCEEGTNKYLEEMHWGLLNRQRAAGSGNFPGWELLEAGRALTAAALHVPARFVLASVYCWGPSSKLGSEQGWLLCSSLIFLACGAASAVKMG